MAGWILVECYVVAYLNPNFTEKQADARDVQEIEHGVCNISSDENSDENQMWVSIIWKSIIKIVCKIESYIKVIHSKYSKHWLSTVAHTVKYQIMV